MRTELHVPSDLRFLPIVESWLLGALQAELGDSVDWPRHSNRLRLVLVEAYSNIVRHAHKDQPNLPVLMRLELVERDISLQLWDYGKGYDLSTYLPPNPEDLQENGYGWLILNKLMDRVEYRLQVNGRNCLTLEATLPDHEFQDIGLGFPATDLPVKAHDTFPPKFAEDTLTDEPRTLPDDTLNPGHDDAAHPPSAEATHPKRTGEARKGDWGVGSGT